MANDPPFHRGNYKLRYTPEEEAEIMKFAKSWLVTKGIASFAGGGGLTYLMIQKGFLASRLKGVKVAAGGFLAFTIARVNAVAAMHKEMREKFPDGYSAQLHYLRNNRDAFNDYVQFQEDVVQNIHARQNQGRPPMGSPRMPQQPTPPPPPPPPPPRANTDSPPTLAGLDDRFRPQMDGILQGRNEQDEDQPKQENRGSYSMWRNQDSKPPPPGLSSVPPLAPPPTAPPISPLPPLPPPSAPPGEYETKLGRPNPPLQSPQPPKKPVRRNKYGDVIEDE